MNKTLVITTATLLFFLIGCSGHQRFRRGAPARRPWRDKPAPANLVLFNYSEDSDRLQILRTVREGKEIYSV